MPVGQSAAQEEPDLLEKPIGSRLILQEKMVLALQGDEVGAGNARSHLAADVDWNHEIAPHMHHECRRFHLGEEVGDIEFIHDVEISGSTLGRGSSALQL